MTEQCDHRFVFTSFGSQEPAECAFCGAMVPSPYLNAPPPRESQNEHDPKQEVDEVPK